MELPCGAHFFQFSVRNKCRLGQFYVSRYNSYPEQFFAVCEVTLIGRGEVGEVYYAKARGF